jgi:hypothetical protein
MKKIFPFLIGAVALCNAAFAQTKEEHVPTANELRVAREANQISREIKKSKREQVALDAPYVGLGLGYMSGISSNSPYKAGINIHGTWGLPILKRRLLLEAQLNLDTRFNANEAWYGRAYDLPVGQELGGVKISFCQDFTYGGYAVVVNNKDMAVVAGPMLGFGYVNAESANGSDMIFTDKGSNWTYCYGLKGAMFLGSHCSFFAQYSMTGIRKADAAHLAYPVSFNALRIGFTYMMYMGGWD